MSSLGLPSCSEKLWIIVAQFFVKSLILSSLKLRTPPFFVLPLTLSYLQLKPRTPPCIVLFLIRSSSLGLPSCSVKLCMIVPPFFVLFLTPSSLKLRTSPRFCLVPNPLPPRKLRTTPFFVLILALFRLKHLTLPYKVSCVGHFCITFDDANSHTLKHNTACCHTLPHVIKY